MVNKTGSLIFRGQITELLSRVRKGKIPGGEFEFSESAKGQIAIAAEIGIPNIGSVSSSGIGTGSSFGEQYSLDIAYELLDTSPRAAIIEGWRLLYRAALESLPEYEESSSSSGDYPAIQPSPAKLGIYLREKGILTPDLLALFDELRKLRNQAVHVDDFLISEKKAQEYLILVALLIEKLKPYKGN
jgi:hypothetical protein